MLALYTCPTCAATLEVDADITPEVACYACGQHLSFFEPEPAPLPSAINVPSLLPPPTLNQPAPISHTAAPPRGSMSRQSASRRPKNSPSPWLASTLGNIIWILFGGGFMAVSYYITGIINLFTIIGIPAGLQCFKLGSYSLLPFGHRVESSRTGCLSGILNVCWFFTGGFLLALGHLLWALLLCLPIVTFPFAIQHYRIAELALLPFGRIILPKDLAST
jgi:uncharacterized membrane protein YccF (DUF307 family)